MTGVVNRLQKLTIDAVILSQAFSACTTVKDWKGEDPRNGSESSIRKQKADYRISNFDTKSSFLGRDVYVKHSDGSNYSLDSYEPVIATISPKAYESIRNVASLWDWQPAAFVVGIVALGIGVYSESGSAAQTAGIGTAAGMLLAYPLGVSLYSVSELNRATIKFNHDLDNY